MRTHGERRAIALAWLFHLVGEIHQTLHTAQLFSVEYPQGTRVGNEICVRVLKPGSRWTCTGFGRGDYFQARISCTTFFSGPSNIAGPVGCQSSFCLMKTPMLLRPGSGGAAVGGARSVPDHAARSNSERAAPSARVGKRFSAPQIVWNKSNRCAGERGGARVGRPRWARILTITGGSSMAALRRGSGQAMIFKLPPQFGQCSMSMSKTRLSSLAQLRRAGAPCA